MNKVTKISITIALIILSIVAYFIISFNSFLSDLKKPWGNGAFDQKIWLTNTDIHNIDNPRGNMIDDLTNNHLYQGQTRQAVISLLGQPSSELIRRRKIIEQSDTIFRKDTLMLYPIGWYSGFRIDPDFLAIRLDIDSLVLEVWKEQH